MNKGGTSENLSISSLLFQAYPLTTFWTVYLNATSGSYSSSARIILKINELPERGTCQVVSNLTGLALETFFTISCFNWKDPDGFIYSYDFYGENFFSFLKKSLFRFNFLDSID